MKLQNHEKFIRDKMEGYLNDLDTQQLWQELEAYVPKKKKRRFPVIFLFIGTVIGLLIGVLLFKTILPSPNDAQIKHEKNKKNQHNSYTVRKDLFNEEMVENKNSLSKTNGNVYSTIDKKR